MNMIKRLFCKLGWHSFRYDLVESYDLVKRDGYHSIANKYRCRWCGYVGMVDSKGNLF